MTKRIPENDVLFLNDAQSGWEDIIENITKTFILDYIILVFPLSQKNQFHRTICIFKCFVGFFF